MGGMRMGGANAAFANRGAFSRGGMQGGFGGGGMRGGGFGGGGRGGGFGGGRGGGGFGGGGFGGGGRGGGGRGGGGRRSDMRLKHDIVLLGRLHDGLGYYRFVYNGGHTVPVPMSWRTGWATPPPCSVPPTPIQTSIGRSIAGTCSWATDSCPIRQSGTTL